VKILIAHLDKCGIYEGPTEVVANLDKELRKLGQQVQTFYESDEEALKSKIRANNNWADVLVVVGYLGSIATESFWLHKPTIWSWDEVPENHWNINDVPLYNRLHDLSQQPNVFIVTGTKDDANVIEKIYKRIDYIVPYGIDYEFYSVGERWERRPPFKILQVGWLGRGKNQQVTLKAFGEFLRYIPHSSLTLVGGKIPLGSGPEYWNECERYIRENNLPASMIGPLPKEKVKEFYYWADVSINPVNNTGGQLTIMESICTGLPTIVSTKFVLRDIVKDFCIVTDDYMGALKEVYKDWGTHHLRALRGKEWIRDNFTWPIWARNILGIIKEKVSED